MSNSDNDIMSEGLFYVVILWLMVGTCNSCTDSKIAKNESMANHDKLVEVEIKIDSLLRENKRDSKTRGQE